MGERDTGGEHKQTPGCFSSLSERKSQVLTPEICLFLPERLLCVCYSLSVIERLNGEQTERLRVTAVPAVPAVSPLNLGQLATNGSRCSSKPGSSSLEPPTQNTRWIIGKYTPSKMVCVLTGDDWEPGWEPALPHRGRTGRNTIRVNKRLLNI